MGALGEVGLWEEEWIGEQRNLAALWLVDWREGNQPGWPAGLELLSRLQYLQYKCDGSMDQDLALLKAIPHVDLRIGGTASLSLTDGVWQSLNVHAKDLRIAFTDVDAFVRGTEKSIFHSTGAVHISQPICEAVRGSCSRQLKACYQCTYRRRSRGVPDIRLCNCEDVMRMEPLRLLPSHAHLTPSSGPRDGYASTPKDSPLWDTLPSGKFGGYKEFWPAWEPFQWVFSYMKPKHVVEA